MTAPTPEAWAYFLEHKDAIRQCVVTYGPVPEMQIPNTRVVDSFPDHLDKDERAAESLPVRYTIADFDAAVEAVDTGKLVNIMNDAWLRAPESRDVYSVPGFTQMCNLLDCTVDGFIPENLEEEE